MAFYKYVKLADLEYFIKNKTIKFTNPHSFNDPFDCNFPYHDELFTDVYERYVVKEMKKRCPDSDEDTAKCIAHLLQPGFNSIRDTIIMDFKKLWHDHISDYRILCLSTENNNILMWSHYADYHKGAVIEIDINKLRLPTSTYNHKNFLKKDIVQYDKYHSHITNMMHKTLKNLNDKLDKQAIYQSFLDNLCEYFIYKMPEWKYENEYRIVISKNNDMLRADDTVSIEQGAIKRVILGCCSKKSEIYEESITMLEENGIPYSLADKKSDRLYIP